MEAENTRLRAALEAAPDPGEEGMTPDDLYAASMDWYSGPRAEALREN